MQEEVCAGGGLCRRRFVQEQVCEEEVCAGAGRGGAERLIFLGAHRCCEPRSSGERLSLRVFGQQQHTLLLRAAGVKHYGMAFREREMPHFCFLGQRIVIMNMEIYLKRLASCRCVAHLSQGQENQ